MAQQVDEEKESKQRIFRHVRAICCGSLDTVLRITSEDDVLDILRVIFWELASKAATSNVWSALMGSLFSDLPLELPDCLKGVNVIDLINQCGIFSDVFLRHFDVLCEEAPPELIHSLSALRERLAPRNRKYVRSDRDSSDSEDGSTLLQRLTKELENAGDEIACRNVFESRIGGALLAGSAEFQRLSSSKLACVNPIDTLTETQMKDVQFRNLYNRVVAELNGYLKTMNKELTLQHINLREMCSLITASQAEIHATLRSGGFDGKDIEFLGRNGCAAVEALDHCKQTDVIMAVCGETSTGKTTLIGALTASQCFPTSDAANSACPIRICATSDPSQQRTFKVPVAFRGELEAAFQAIQFAIDGLRCDRISLDKPWNVVSQEACDLYNAMVAAREPIRLTLEVATEDSNTSVLGAEEMDAKILQSITTINGLVRLFYYLKDSPRFSARLGDLDPLSVLLNADDILDVLPVLTSYCECVEQLPFVGRINVIDTPGVSESIERGSFMERTKVILQKIVERSDRIIILATPTTISNGASKELRKNILSLANGRDKIIVAVNKFDLAERSRDPHSLEVTLDGYRAEFAKEGLQGINVHILQANVLGEVRFGWRDITNGLEPDVEIMKWVKANRNHLSAQAVSLLVALCGKSFWKEPKTNDQLKTLCLMRRRQSNFENILQFALVPAFLKVMTRDPTACLQYNSKMIGSIITSLNTRLTGTLKKADSVKLLQSSLEKIDELFFQQLKQIREDIQRALLKDFIRLAERGVQETNTRINRTVDFLEKETFKNQNIPFNSRRREFKRIVDWRGSSFECLVSTKVFFRKQSDCAKEDKRVLSKVNEILFSTGIEGDWEAARVQIIKSVLEFYLRKVGDAIGDSLALELGNDAQLQDMFDSIFSEISNCFIGHALPINNAFKFDLSLDTLKTEKEAESLLGQLFFSREDIFVPQYGVVKQLALRAVAQRYSQANCATVLKDMDRYISQVLKSVTTQLVNVHEGLQHHKDRLESDVIEENVDMLRANIMTLKGSLHKHHVLITAIERKCSSQIIADEMLECDGLKEVWKLRLQYSSCCTVKRASADNCPIRQLLEGCISESVTFFDATAQFINACVADESLKEFETELEQQVMIAKQQAEFEGAKQIPHGLTVDEFAILKLYSLSTAFFRIINRVLGSFDIAVIGSMEKVLKLLLKASSKLPRPSNDTLFRVVNKSIQLTDGEEFQWNCFSSISTDMKTATSTTLYRDGSGSSSNSSSSSASACARTHFCIRLADNSAARSLQRLSVFQDQEVLIPPFTKFKVINVGHRYRDGRQDVHVQEISVGPPVPPFSHFTEQSEEDEVVCIE